MLRRVLPLPQLIKRSASTAIYTWGSGTQGQLGHEKFALEKRVVEDSYIQPEPRRLLKSKSIDSVACGNEYSLALTSSGDLLGWGKNFLGENQSRVPQVIPVGVKFKSVSAGFYHSAAIDTAGQVHTWGHGGSWFSGGGQLGHNSTSSENFPKLVESFRSYGAKAAAVSCGKQHTLVLTEDGEVLSCGIGEYGRLGTGSTSDALELQSLEGLADEDTVQVAAGLTHSLSLSADGKIFSWGRNDRGQLGLADSNMDIYSMEDYPRALEVSLTLKEDKRAVQIMAGDGRSGFVTADGKLYLWGSRLSHVPVQVDSALFNGLRVTRAAIGGQASNSAVAVITEDGSLWTFGDPSSNMLAISGQARKINLTKNSTPVRVPLFEGVTVHDVFGGFGLHMAAKVDFVPKEGV